MYGFKLIYPVLCPSVLLIFRGFLLGGLWLDFIPSFKKALFNTYQSSTGTNINFAV